MCVRTPFRMARETTAQFFQIDLVGDLGLHALCKNAMHTLTEQIEKTETHNHARVHAHAQVYAPGCMRNALVQSDSDLYMGTVFECALLFFTCISKASWWARLALRSLRLVVPQMFFFNWHLCIEWSGLLEQPMLCIHVLFVTKNYKLLNDPLLMMSSPALVFLCHRIPRINSNVTGSPAKARSITSLGGHFSHMFSCKW